MRKNYTVEIIDLTGDYLAFKVEYNKEGVHWEFRGNISQDRKIDELANYINQAIEAIERKLKKDA